MSTRPGFGGEMTRLGDLGKTQGGGTPSSKHPEYFTGTIPWIGTTALNGKLLDERDAVKMITEEAVAKSATKIVPAGSIMVGIRVGVGKVAINDVPMCTSQDIVSIIGVDERQWNKEYILLALKYRAPILATQAQGATITGISSKTLKEITVPTLTLAFQDEIVSQLKNIEQQIAHAKKQLAQLNSLVKSRFVEMFERSQEWDLRTLAECCETPNDIKCGPFGSQLHKDDYISEGIPVWGIPEVSSGFAKMPNKYVSPESANRLQPYSLIPGDIAMNRKGNVGQAALFDGSKPSGIIHSDVLRVRVNQALVDPAFLVEQLHSSQVVREQIMSASTGAIMAGTNVTKLKKIKVFVPPLSLQRQFAGLVSQVDKARCVAQQQVEKLQTLYDSLAQEYFS